MAKKSNITLKKEEIVDSTAPQNKPQVIAETPLLELYCQKLEEIIN